MNNIRKLREERGWSQAQLSEIAGINVRTVQRAEAGDKLEHETVKAIAAAFDITVTDLRPKRLRDRVRIALEEMADYRGNVTATVGQLHDKIGDVEHLGDLHEALIQLKSQGVVRLYIEGDASCNPNSTFEATLVD